GRICVLEDNDGSGIFDSRTVYAENIANPTALTCYAGGVFVAASGQIIYLKDTQGNGVADARREVFKSFGDATNGANGQVVITGMEWGLDNRIHVVTTGYGGDVISSSLPSQSVALSEGSFSFDPRTFALAAESGSGASGLSFDDHGQRVICTPTGQIQVIWREARYAARNPFYEMPANLETTNDDRAAFIYPLVHGGIPVNVRTADPNSGIPLPVPFSAAGGLAIYHGNAFPSDYWGDAFIADAAANVIHRAKLRQNGPALLAQRAADEPGVEFLAGRDNSFEPTQVINAPDGAIYITGLSHNQELIAANKANAVLAAAPARGRIYRVVPVNFKQPKFTPLGKLSAEQLAATLRNPNGWQRDTASRLLYEREDHATVVPLIRVLFDPLASPLARMRALCALDGIELNVQGRPTRALLESHLLKALNDPDDRVRERAVLLSEKFVSKAGTWSEELWGQLSRMGSDPSPQVRWQLAFTLGQGHNSGRAQALANIIRTDPRAFPAALTSLSDDAAEVFGLTVGDGRIRNDADGQNGLNALIQIVGQKNAPPEIAQVLNTLQGLADPGTAFKMALELENGMAQADASLFSSPSAQAALPIFARAASVAVDLGADSSARVEALQLLASGSAVDASIPVTLARQWLNFDSTMRRGAVAAMLLRPEWTSGLLATVQMGLIPRTDLDLEQIRFVLAYPNAELRGLAQILFANWNGLERQAVVNRYSAVPQMNGNPERGHAIFLKNCAVCHQTADEPTARFITYSLVEASKADKQKILDAILTPNRPTPSTHPEWLFQMRNGELVTGFVGSENAKGYAISDLSGAPHYLARSDITSQKNLGISGMPDDWENLLNAQDMADLLQYLTAGRK
ncbi:MAG TPA: PVC-type heme-binding CxxCH protein, partial [Verrucomicrobiae bacterium]|nr:PVC-type heme-binding CxxCH protein [Verrucomicrobiae bacterium]